MGEPAAIEAMTKALETESLEGLLDGFDGVDDIEAMDFKDMDFENIDMEKIEKLDTLNTEPIDPIKQQIIDKLKEGKIISDLKLENAQTTSETLENINNVEPEKSIVDKGANIDFDAKEPTEAQTAERNNQMKTEMTDVNNKINEFKSDLTEADADTIVDKGIESLENASGETISDDIKNDIKKASKEVIDDIDGKLDKAMDRINEKLKNLNDKIEPEEGKSLSETVKDIFMGLVEVLKILGPIFGMWFMFNLISYVFSECYWIPVNKNCKFYDNDGNELEDWSKLQHTKKRMKKKNTQKSLYARLTFQKSDNNAECACNSAADSFLKVVANANEKDRYGTITTDKDVKDPCTSSQDDKGNTIACFERGAQEEDERKPMCLTYDTNGNSNVIERNRRAKVACGGYYKKYDCNLSEMVNSFAKLVDMVAHTNPLDLIKKIIYIIVAIIAVFFVISIVRYILRKKSE